MNEVVTEVAKTPLVPPLIVPLALTCKESPLFKVTGPVIEVVTVCAVACAFSIVISVSPAIPPKASSVDVNTEPTVLAFEPPLVFPLAISETATIHLRDLLQTKR